MKTIKVIIFILISILYFGCACPPLAVEIRPLSFPFSIIDKEGKDLFFDENSIYDPHNVKFAVGQEEEFPQYWFQVDESQKCFRLYSFYPRGKPYMFYMEFIPSKTDTIKINSRYGKSERCDPPSYNIEVFFNNTLICTECKYNQVHKIEK